MTAAQRKVVLVIGIVLAPVFFVAGVVENSILVSLAGPVVSIGVGIFVWAGRD